MTASELRLHKLTREHSYMWRVFACNTFGCTRSSKFHFHVDAAPTNKKDGKSGLNFRDDLQSLRVVWEQLLVWTAPAMQQIAGRLVE